MITSTLLGNLLAPSGLHAGNLSFDIYENQTLASQSILGKRQRSDGPHSNGFESDFTPASRVETQQRLMQLFPDLYTGHHKTGIELCDFMQHEWTKPKYDNSAVDIYTENFDELIPFAEELKLFIQNQPDDLHENMRKIKRTLAADLTHSITHKKISMNEIWITTYRYVAAISDDDGLRNFEEQKGFEKFHTNWETKNVLKSDFKTTFGLQYRELFRLKYLQTYLAIDPSAYKQDNHSYRRKLPLHIQLPVLNETFLGIRFMIDRILNYQFPTSIPSYRETIKADGIYMSPFTFMSHDYGHYLGNNHGIPRKLMNKSWLKKGPAAKENKLLGITRNYSSYLNILKSFMQFYDDSFLKNMDTLESTRYPIQAEQESLKNSIKENYLKIQISVFWLLHETGRFDECDVADSWSKVLERHINKEKREGRLALDDSFELSFENEESLLGLLESYRPWGKLNKNDKSNFKKSKPFLERIKKKNFKTDKLSQEKAYIALQFFDCLDTFKAEFKNYIVNSSVK